MKRYILFLYMVLGVVAVSGQVSTAFTTVPEVNGKVVFEQFVLADQGLSSSQKYATIQKWVKDKYAGNSMVAGIRFDDKGQAVTVSLKNELSGVTEKTVMNYRFDLSVANAGCILLVRDITYQNVPQQGVSFPKNIAAEQVITDQSVSVSGDEGQRRKDIRKATLAVVNNLYGEVTNLFDPN